MISMNLPLPIGCERGERERSALIVKYAYFQAGRSRTPPAQGCRRYRGYILHRHEELKKIIVPNEIQKTANECPPGKSFDRCLGNEMMRWQRFRREARTDCT